jgi:hypothetical protein
MFGNNIPQGLLSTTQEIFGASIGGRVFLERKLNRLGIAGISSTTPVAGELPDKVIQRSPEVVDRISHDNPPVTEPLIREHCFSPKDVVSALSLEIQGQSYSVGWRHDSTRSTDGTYLALKGVAVLFSPVDFGPDAGEIRLVGHG